MTDIEFPEKLKFLFEPHPYKVLWGGRGGIKSWSIAAALALLASERPLRILCARELMKSIAESVHELLEQTIARVGLADFYRIEKAGLFGRNGSEFAFTGLRDAHNLKSYEGFDIAWIEEAANVSKRSWDLLLPTIRKKGSEIWISFNPELETDETYVRWVLHPPPGAVVVKTSFRDNNWLTEELQRKIEHMRAVDPDGYENIYEGVCKQVLDGAIYADEMRTLARNGHILRVPYDPAKPVQTFWDLGIADQTAIWFVQSIAFEHRFIDYYQARNKALAHYLQVLQSRGYVYGSDHLPHDGQRRDLGTGKSIETHMREAGRRVKLVPQIGLANGLNSARALFARAWFDAEKCADGLNCLRRYRWKVDETTGLYSKTPLHDDSSNGADAYRMAAVGLTEPEKQKEQQRRKLVSQVSPWS